MKKYLAVCYDCIRELHHEIEAENFKEAKAKAFQWMCDCSGDHIHDVQIYELRQTVKCDGEYNPGVFGFARELARRDYYTGNVIRQEKGGERV